MKHQTIADRAGVMLGDLAELMKGKATKRLADRLNLSVGDVESFLKGTATVSMQRRLGLASLSAVEELARTKGPDGAVGVILGLLISN